MQPGGRSPLTAQPMGVAGLAGCNYDAGRTHVQLGGVLGIPEGVRAPWRDADWLCCLRGASHHQALPAVRYEREVASPAGVSKSTAAGLATVAVSWDGPKSGPIQARWVEHTSCVTREAALAGQRYLTRKHSCCAGWMCSGGDADLPGSAPAMPGRTRLSITNQRFPSASVR